MRVLLTVARVELDARGGRKGFQLKVAAGERRERDVARHGRLGGTGKTVYIVRRRWRPRATVCRASVCKHVRRVHASDN